ncbi:uncharacterized protein LOC141790635 [Halichoeres trimaculatus]|uniref:uncharacterized protein LOC141790635 n=1 Tax=Halichoeres trimaculatus TaxID=147232 RepID=UPI003D9DCEDD
MPLFRAAGEGCESRRRRMRNRRKVRGITEEDGSVLPLTRLCLLSLADHMKDEWAKDYADNYLDQYSFRYIMGPFNLLPGELVEELTLLLCNRKQLSRAALHLLLVPQLRALSLEKCPGLVTSALCSHITARCQGLWSLDLSGVQQLPTKILSDTLHCLPALRSLSLAGTPCDERVIKTIAQRCHFLRYLDVSRCHSLSPAALLPLGGRASLSSYDCLSRDSNSTSRSPSHFFPPSLSCLLALDIGFGEEEGDPVAAAAYLLLSLPCLEKVAMEGVAQACCLIQKQDFNQTCAFTDRERVPRLEEVWRQRLDIDNQSKETEGETDGGEKVVEEDALWEGFGSENEEDLNDDEGLLCSQSQATEKRRAVWSQSGDDLLILQLKDVRGLSCDCLDSVSQLCPNIHSISVNIDEDEESRGRNQGSLLAAALQTWSGQLRSLSLNYQGPLLDLLPALQLSGSSLVNLTLEGIKTSPHSPLMDIIRACPRLRDMMVSAESPNMLQEEDNEAQQLFDPDLPTLPNLVSLKLKFSYDHSQLKPIMSWMSLKKVLKCLMAGSPFLETLSLVSLPCPLGCVLQDVLSMVDEDLDLNADSTHVPPIPLKRLQHLDLQRTDINIATVESLMLHCKRLKFIDLSCCWQISRLEYLSCASISKAKLVWS